MIADTSKPAGTRPRNAAGPQRGFAARRLANLERD